MNWPDDPAAWLSPPGLLGAWIATVDGRLLGHVALTGDGADGAEVGRLFVTPEARGEGMAVVLLEAATRHARTPGRRVELRVVEDSTAAIRLYERLGWTLLGTGPAPFTRSDGTRPIERRYRQPVHG